MCLPWDFLSPWNAALRGKFREVRRWWLAVPTAALNSSYRRTRGISALRKVIAQARKRRMPDAAVGGLVRIGDLDHHLRIRASTLVVNRWGRSYTADGLDSVFDRAAKSCEIDDENGTGLWKKPATRSGKTDPSGVTGGTDKLRY